MRKQRAVSQIYSAFIVLTIISLSVSGQMAENPAESQATDAPVLTWPRVFQPDGHEVVMYQPQLEEWKDHAIITGKSAVAVMVKGQNEPIYGAATLKASTQTDMENRTVLFSDFKIPDVHFPNIDKEKAVKSKTIVTSIVPKQKTMQVSLDRVIASVERSSKQNSIEVNLEPPPIFYSEKPAILMIFLGEPKFEQVKGSELLFAVNTNWDMFLDPTSSNYYLLNEESWLTTKDVKKGPWTAATKLPAGLTKLPDDDNWQDVRKNIPGKPAKVVPTVFVSATPAELIVTDGVPQYQPISGTKLLSVSNCESDLFTLSGADGKRYYLLLAGRWFGAKELSGSWESVTKNLPMEFAKIPEDSPCAHVLSSVPGTPDAEAAILLASVPRKATVSRKDTAVTVVYQGEPKFVAIEGTTVFYAVNTPSSVLRVDDMYYCCHQGIWFFAFKPAGPWKVAASIPQVIYTIPPTSPVYNVTYVHIYESSPTEVTVGYTSGYTGQYVAHGLLMFGLGYAIGHNHDWDDHWHYASFHYHSSYFSYGCGARYDYYAGGYVRAGAARVYGPYGGAGRWAAYNPVTGGYDRGAYRYGPRGSAYAREAYNPHTGRYAGRITASNVYGSWGRSVVSGKDGWAQFGHRSGSRGSVGGFRTSEGAAGVVGEGRFGHTGGIAKDKHGDAYVGRDGNIYKRSDKGQWQKHTGDGWNDVVRPEPRGVTATPRTATPRPTTRPSNRSFSTRESNIKQLDRSYQNRRAGERRASTFQRSRQSIRGGGGRRNGGGIRRR
jgi:hypothetical protein